jgi:hypothetical protein
MEQSASVILGSLSEKESSCHGDMWGMCLSYSKALPEAWTVVDAKKAVLPKLLSLLRHVAPSPTFTATIIFMRDQAFLFLHRPCLVGLRRLI